MARTLTVVALCAALGLAAVAAIALADGTASIRATTTTRVAEPAAHDAGEHDDRHGSDD